jgi:hypothetical protein
MAFGRKKPSKWPYIINLQTSPSQNPPTDSAEEAFFLYLVEQGPRRQVGVVKDVIATKPVQFLRYGKTLAGSTAASNDDASVVALGNASDPVAHDLELLVQFQQVSPVSVLHRTTHLSFSLGFGTVIRCPRREKGYGRGRVATDRVAI